MKKQERADYVRKRLSRLYPKPQPPLDHSDHFSLLIAVLLSAQCTDKKVNEVTPALFEVAPDPQGMLRLGEAGIKEKIRSIGLAPQKARAIFGLSQILLDKHQGQVPKGFEPLEELPGVGHKTASVVMSQAFGEAAFPVDTHIHRLAKRWRLSSGKSVTHTEKDLKALFPKRSWNKLHLQIIFYGREYCTARGCDGKSCPICTHLATH